MESGKKAVWPKKSLAGLVLLMVLSACDDKKIPQVAPPEVNTGTVPTASNGLPRVCDNDTLLNAIRIINRACNDADCDFENLKQLNSGVDKPTLFAALRNSDLKPVHLFFPENVSDVTQSFDWQTIKQAQIDSLRLEDASDAVVFVLGRASMTGEKIHNVTLSRERMASVLNYLRLKLMIKCRTFRGAWFGNQILYLYESDAGLLGIPRQDWRGNELVLNQAVHVFIVPCGNLVVG